MKRRLWIAVALSVPIVILDMGGHFLGIDHLLPHGWMNWILLVLATPVVLWAAGRSSCAAGSRCVTRNLNMFTLIALGTGTAWLYSVVATVAPGLFPASFLQDGAIAGLFRAGGRHHLPGAGRPGARTARPRFDQRRHQGAARPRAAHRAQGRRRRQRCRRADRIDRRRRPSARAARREGAGRRRGDRRPQRRRRILITGEPMPVTKEAGAKVVGGTVNRTGTFVMKAEKVGADTMLARIVKMVAEAQRSRAPIQRLADSVSSWFVPLVVVIAAGSLRRLVRLGAGAALRLRPAGRRLRADHRLPLRAGTRHADVDHGRRRPRRRCRRPDPQRRGAGAAGEGRHAGGRQDRHADRGPARRHRDRAAGRAAEAEVLRLAASLERGSEHPHRHRDPGGGARAQGRAGAGRATSIRRPARAWSAASTASACCWAMRRS